MQFVAVGARFAYDLCTGSARLPRYLYTVCCDRQELLHGSLRPVRDSHTTRARAPHGFRGICMRFPRNPQGLYGMQKDIMYNMSHDIVRTVFRGAKKHLQDTCLRWRVFF